jgi:AbrB family looped-hinge helix DNA binding protein
VTTTVKVLPKGQITLPRKLRTDMHINEGDTLVLEQTDDGVIIRRGKTIFDFLGVLPGKGLSIEQIREKAGAEVAKERA